jgi:hypothetical protein
VAHTAVLKLTGNRVSIEPPFEYKTAHRADDLLCASAKILVTCAAPGMASWSSAWQFAGISAPENIKPPRAFGNSRQVRAQIPIDKASPSQYTSPIKHSLQFISDAMKHIKEIDAADRIGKSIVCCRFV